MPVITEGAQVSLSFTVSLQARTPLNMARMSMWGMWSRDKLVSVCTCQVHNCALKLLSKSVKQWGRVCILCEGHRAGRAGSLASACLGCNGNCSATCLPNVLSYCSLHFPDKVYTTNSYGVVSVAGGLKQTWKEMRKFWPRKPLKCRMDAHVQQHSAVLRRTQHGDWKWFIHKHQQRPSSSIEGIVAIKAQIEVQQAQEFCSTGTQVQKNKACRWVFSRSVSQLQQYETGWNHPGQDGACMCRRLYRLL